MTTRLVEIVRGSEVESVHFGSVVVVDRSGQLIARAGDPDLFAYFRSCAKPFQAIPVIESGASDAFGITAAELALCCASHYGEAHHQQEVAAFLVKLGLDEHALRCGISAPIDDAQYALVETGAIAASPLQCDCSGKHSGMLAACLQEGWPTETYLHPEHPLQVQIKQVVADCCALAPDDFVMATDGCSVPTFGASLRSFANAFAMLAASAHSCRSSDYAHANALQRLATAMTAHPENVSGDGSLVTDLMRESGGKVVAKSGAEGMICLSVPEMDLGIAIRIADGSFRSHPVVVLSVLRQLQAIDEATIGKLEAMHPSVVRNHNGWEVGSMNPVFELTSR